VTSDIDFLRSLNAHDDGFVCGWHGLTGARPGKGVNATMWHRGFEYGTAMRSAYGN
jgi:hypothetical protein